MNQKNKNKGGRPIRKLSPELKEIIRKGLNQVSSRDAYVLTKRFALFGGQPQSLKQIAKFQNISKQRVKQLEDRAIRKIYELQRD